MDFKMSVCVIPVSFVIICSISIPTDRIDMLHLEGGLRGE